ncbi:GbsR/MarR family transcriptional regulator [Actinoalloteichus hymeniacidonis]|uniref:Transcriptional regulator n=1 Tax=Actinoalloteichus hymeniacidonis TaxID=340345 RepID=A0AAC9MYP3_9PSEU|nr:MarR family transcriptional regulator [Actinoalloteichus hymeniacidonis]AOS63121.1 putative transcriptional regulator [Actinoalloteichus hymeniacidonis]MBB5908843.1 DNA-binding transcriptional ArsR family regulator [Actinoalloteichus hymeniacidonis]
MSQDQAPDSGSPTAIEERDPDEIARFLERFALAFSNTGIPRMAARTFVAIMISDEGTRTAAELSAQFGVGASAISGAVKYLEQLRLVTRERDPGQRRDHYRVDADVWGTLFRRRLQWLEDWDRGAREGAELLGRSTPAGRRLSEMVEMMDFLAVELPAMLGRWYEHRDAIRAAAAG